MVYCPPATGLKKYKDSLWMSTQIEGKESMKLTREFAELKAIVLCPKIDQNFSNSLLKNKIMNVYLELPFL